MHQHGVHELDSQARLEGYTSSNTNARIVPSRLQLKVDLLKILPHGLLRQRDRGGRLESDAANQRHTRRDSADQASLMISLITRVANLIVVFASSSLNDFLPGTNFTRLHGVQSSQSSHEAELQTFINRFTCECRDIDCYNLNGCT